MDCNPSLHVFEMVQWESNIQYGWFQRQQKFFLGSLSWEPGWNQQPSLLMGWTACAQIPWRLEVWKQGYRVRNFFKLSRESYLLTFWFFTRERNEIISSNVAVCVHERPVFALLFLLRIKNFNSDSSRFRNESKGNFQPREYLLFE